jgi:radical SAM protein with 4Fe4S-binding SPASM domain
MATLKTPPKLEGYVYSFNEAKKARDSGKILSIRLETSRRCNLKCKYCCNRSGKPLKNEITYKKIIEIIEQAKALKVKSIIIIGGGEPTIYPKFKKLIGEIINRDIIPVIFTNTQTMTLPLAKFLYKNNTSVIIKMDSLNESVQDKMVGVKGAYKKIQQGLHNLLLAGYGNLTKQGKYKLGASFVVNKMNISEVPKIWEFCRDRNIFPNLEMMVPNGNAKEEQNLLLDSSEWAKLKTELLCIDQKKYNYTWLPYTPLVGAGCFQVLYNLYISVTGEVRPCSSIHCHVANINEMSLKEIINLPFFKLARNVDKHLTGKCGKCNHHTQCIGCRGLAFASNANLGKDEITSLCAEDPSCFYNGD